MELKVWDRIWSGVANVFYFKKCELPYSLPPICAILFSLHPASPFTLLLFFHLPLYPFTIVRHTRLSTVVFRWRLKLSVECHSPTSAGSELYHSPVAKFHSVGNPYSTENHPHFFTLSISFWLFFWVFQHPWPSCNQQLTL